MSKKNKYKKTKSCGLSVIPTVDETFDKCCGKIVSSDCVEVETDTIKGFAGSSQTELNSFLNDKIERNKALLGIYLRWVSPPESLNSDGSLGEVSADENYIYFYFGDRWNRVVIDQNSGR